jgi:hypothetical protein
MIYAINPIIQTNIVCLLAPQADSKTSGCTEQRSCGLIKPTVGSAAFKGRASPER